jgi:putative phosphoribosyl transferase
MKQSLKIDLDNVTLEGELTLPANAMGVVIFSHGSGSSRFSPRNNFVAQHLQRRDLGTFLFDLLTKEEDEIYSMRFNIDLLAHRLVQVTQWLLKMPAVQKHALGYFGASTGAASAIVAASILQRKISAVVSRGGRPDLAKDELYKVEAPTLLLVGENDQVVLDLNERALEKLAGIKLLEIIKGATHLFEEPGTLEQVAQLSGDWFTTYLSPRTVPSKSMPAKKTK